jgi:hypothetical protein
MKMNHTESGFVFTTFTDLRGETCGIYKSSLGGPAKIWLGRVCNEMNLTQEHVRELLPLLQHFAETGELPP